METANKKTLDNEGRLYSKNSLNKTYYLKLALTSIPESETISLGLPVKVIGTPWANLIKILGAYLGA